MGWREGLCLLEEWGEKGVEGGKGTKVKYQEASLQSSSIANSFKGERKDNQSRNTSVFKKMSTIHTYKNGGGGDTYSRDEGSPDAVVK